MPRDSTWRGRVTATLRGERSVVASHTRVQVDGRYVYVKSQVPNPFAAVSESAGQPAPATFSGRSTRRWAR